MEFKVNKRNVQINLHKEDRNEIYDIIRLEKKGISYSEGRTCYYILKHPIFYNNLWYYSVKIKGAGFYDKEENIFLPGKSEFIRKDPHYGFDCNGNAIKIFSDIAPFGGMVISKALNEYNNFEFLNSVNVSTLIPIAVCEYEDLSFNNDSLAVTVALCTEQFPYRMYKLLWNTEKISKDACEYYNLILKNEKIVGNIADFETKSKLIQKLAQKYTTEIKKFSEGGLYIHSGGWSNIQYNMQNSNIVLVDLDSSRHIPQKYNKFSSLYGIRDLVSNIYRLLISLYNPDIISQYDEKIIFDTNYVLYLLYGYFPNVNKEMLVEISNEILEYYVKSCFNRIKSIEYKMNDLEQKEVEKYELSMFDFYDFCIKRLRGLL